MDNKPVILYADDDPDDREMLHEYILSRNSSYEVVEVANGREALLYLQSSKSLQNPPVLVILDLNMPILSGRETLAIIKSEQETEHLPVVVFTTSSATHDKDFCKKFGVTMVTKPQTLEEIKDAVDVLLKFIKTAA